MALSHKPGLKSPLIISLELKSCFTQLCEIEYFYCYHALTDAISLMDNGTIKGLDFEDESVG